MEGWIKLHRMIQNNDLWMCEPFTRGQAWVDLLLIANHKESFFYKRGNKVIVKRGQVGRSEVELSDRWKWSRTKVRKFLKDLEKEQQIEIHKSRITQVLTIINYDLYQQEEQQKDNRKTTEEQQKNIYKNDKNIKYKYIPIYKELVNFFIEITGKTIRIANTDSKILRQNNFKTISARLENGADIEEMKAIIKMKHQEWNGTKQEKYIRFETLFAPIKYQIYLNELDNYSEAEEKPKEYDLKKFYVEEFGDVYLKANASSIPRDLELFDKAKHKLEEIALSYPNPSIDVYFLWLTLYKPLGAYLRGNKPDIKIQAFDYWYNQLSDYNKNKGDIKALLRKHNQKAKVR